MNGDYKLKERKYNSAKDFIKYLQSLPDPDLTDPEVSRNYHERIRKRVDKEIKKIKFKERTWGR